MNVYYVETISLHELIKIDCSKEGLCENFLDAFYSKTWYLKEASKNILSDNPLFYYLHYLQVKLWVPCAKEMDL